MLKSLRNPHNLSRKKPRLGLPKAHEGVDGDLQLHITEGGLGLYGKVSSRWFKFGNAEELSTKGKSNKSRRFLQDMSVRNLSVSRTLSIDNAYFSTDPNFTSTNRDYLQIHSQVFTLESSSNKSQIDVGDIVLQRIWGSSSTASTISVTTSEGHGADLKITSGGTEGINKNGGDLLLAAGNKSGSGTVGSITLGASPDGSVNATALNINASNTIIAATLTLNEHTSGTVGIQTVQDSGTSFVDNDTSLMTAAAIADKIEGYGYSTASGDITGVTITTDSGGGSAASDTGGSADFSILGSNGVGVTNSGTTITAQAVPGEIDHDSLNNWSADKHIDWTASSAGTIHSTNYSNTMGSGFTVSATTDSNATTITQGDDLMFTAGTGITCETTADGTVTIANTVSAPTNYVTDDADDVMAGTLTIDKNSTATTDGATQGLLIDYDHTGITASGQTITNVGLKISMLNNSVTHVGTHVNLGIDNSVRSNTTGASTIYGFYNYTSTADTIYGIYNESTGAGTTGYGIYQKVDDGDTDYIQVSSANTADYFKMSTTANGATTLETVDGDAALAHLTLDPDGDLLISGADVMIDAGKKLYFDGDGHTYFTESSDDVFDLYVGGTQIYRISELGVNSFFEMMAGGGFSVPFQAPLYLDGGANTYIKSNTADQISLHCGAATVFTIAEDGSTNGDYASFGTTGAGFTQFEPTYDATDTYVFFNRKGNKAHLTFLATGTAIDDIHMHFPPVSGNFQLLIKQHAAGGGSVNNWKTFDKAGSNESTVVWPAATAPTLTTGGSKIDIISLYWDADNNKAYGVASLNF